MATLIILSHSPKIAEGTKELAAEMAANATIVAIGGTSDGSLGADFDRTLAALQQAAAEGDVIVLADLGSTRMTVQMAWEELDEAAQQHVHLHDAALVEGSIVAAVGLSAGMDMDVVLGQLDELKLAKD